MVPVFNYICWQTLVIYIGSVTDMQTCNTCRNKLPIKQQMKIQCIILVYSTSQKSIPVVLNSQSCITFVIDPIQLYLTLSAELLSWGRRLSSLRLLSQVSQSAVWIQAKLCGKLSICHISKLFFFSFLKSFDFQIFIQFFPSFSLTCFVNMGPYRCV